MESSTVSPAPIRRVRRRWRIPPAIMYGPEPLESACVFDELSGAAGLVLWQSLRDVTLWANTPPAERDGLFCATAERKRIAAILGAGLEPALEQPLGMITAMVGHPGRVSAQRVALACRQVAQWAESSGKLATALAFAQAGAVACPGDASTAFKVGQIARRRAEYVRAETWFRRAIALGRQEGDWVSYSLGFAGLGTLYMQRGNIPKARALQMRCLRAAKRHSLRDVQGGACYDLHVIATASGQPEEAQRYARAAFEAYGPRHPNLPRLAHDVAYFWMTQGQFAPALSVFLALESHFKLPSDRLVVMSNAARAAGGLGNTEFFERVWSEVWNASDSKLRIEYCAEMFLELARGAASLKQWDRAEVAAQRSFDRAQGRAERRIELEAESVLDMVRRQMSAVCSSQETALARQVEEVDSLAEQFVMSLAACEVA
jgi:tetratricopeptide (TPR) repeat protein